MAAVMARRARAAMLPQVDPNVIPFIDVLLVLLIIFMVTAPKPTTDLRLDLPRPGPSIAAAIPPTIVQLRETAGGYAIFVGEKETTLARLTEDALAYMMAANPALEAADAHAEGRIYVRSDLGVAYQHIVTVLETLQDARFRCVAIYAQDADEDAQN